MRVITLGERAFFIVKAFTQRHGERKAHGEHEDTETRRTQSTRKLIFHLSSWNPCPLCLRVRALFVMIRVVSVKILKMII